MPPATVVRWADPFFAPAQVTFVVTTVDVIGAGLVIVPVAVPVHPNASVTVTVYVPAARPEADDVILADRGAAHAYVYAPEPPLACMSISPLFALLHVIGVTTADTASADTGWVMVALSTTLQLLASFTVTEYDPAVAVVYAGPVLTFGDHV